MLASDLALLRDTFDAWCRGDPCPDAAAWHQFRRDLHAAASKAAMAEVGIALDTFKVLAECLKGDTNVRLLPSAFGPRQQGGPV